MPQKLDPNTSDIAVDAMCVWEWVLENRDEIPALKEQFEQLGTCQMRERSVSIVPELREAFEVAKKNGYEDCFDWEFVPWFMTHFVRFEDYGWTCALLEDVMPEGRPPKPEWEKEADAAIATRQPSPCANCGLPVVRRFYDDELVHVDADEDPKSEDYGWTQCSGGETFAELVAAGNTSEKPVAKVEESQHVDQPGDRDVFVLFCRMLGRDEPSGTVHEDGKPPAWDTYETEREAQLEILDGIEEHIRHFRAGVREFDEIDFDSFYVVPATLHADGTLSTENGDYGLPEQ